MERITWESHRAGKELTDHPLRHKNPQWGVYVYMAEQQLKWYHSLDRSPTYFIAIYVNKIIPHYQEEIKT
jgi:hypothetical protein